MKVSAKCIVMNAHLDIFLPECLLGGWIGKLGKDAYEYIALDKKPHLQRNGYLASSFDLCRFYILSQP